MLRFVFVLFFFIASFASAEPAKRIIALSPHSVELLYSIGAGDKIIATTEHADFPEIAKQIPIIGGHHGISIEKVLELNPDLIVYWGSGNKPQDIQRLKALGFDLYNSDPKTLSQVVSDITALGKLTGNERLAETKVVEFQDQLMSLTEQYQAKTKVRVFYQLWSTPLITVAKNSWIQQLLDVCQGENVFYDAASDYPQVSVENVLLVKPDVILASEDEGNLQGINWKKWPIIPAVKNQHIYALNADTLHRPTLRALEGVKSICQTLDNAR